MTGALTVSFTRRRGRADQVHVTRGDTTTTGWEFPSYGDALPHDLVHLVVEEGLDLTDGFWGLIDQGAYVVMVGDQAVLTRDGVPLAQRPDTGFAGLRRAEEAVAILGPQPHLEQSGEIILAWVDPGSFATPDLPGTARRLGFQLPQSATSDRVDTIHTRLRDLARRWRDGEDGTITLTWHRASTSGR
ncbi:hypothetical protein CcI49_30645 [Frankia sp. CcI49]|uniref:hypothetical protein n=1 Tax=Frankia sp. CcI49 TaxID=1745382 RepID=UPI00097842BD|nr:hypothetical protein [Frankia sp. CcI49]ONH54706.1 hypothetical protein CcI49_30645 [Frankia sp. CcI49]